MSHAPADPKGVTAYLKARTTPPSGVFMACWVLVQVPYLSQSSRIRLCTVQDTAIPP
jgi:hypothetical protein